MGTEDFLQEMADWDGNGVVVRHDAPTGTWIFIALHDTSLGQPVGGSRMKVYPSLADAVRDAQRLASGMTSKWAALDMPIGGGKAVLAIPEPLDEEARGGLLDRYADLIHSLNGAYTTGADLGTSAADMGRLRQRTPFVLGAEADGSSTDPGPFTARGVLCGLRAALKQVFGSDDPTGRSILVEGLGGVGSPLAHELAELGADLIFADLNAKKAADYAKKLGGRAIDLAAVPDTACDVYAPCAIGATVNADTIARFQCKIVAGSANNQLAETQDAERLHERGIVYVPDYIGNAGGAMAIALMHEDIKERQELFCRVETIGKTVAEVLQEASEENITPGIAADRRVARRLAAAREAS